MRTTLSPAFTSSKMKFVFPCINDISLNIIQYLNGTELFTVAILELYCWARQLNLTQKICIISLDHEGEDIDVDDLIRRYTNDVIATAGFGFQVDSLKDRDNEFYKAGNRLFDFDFKQRMLMLLVPHFPQIIKVNY